MRSAIASPCAGSLQGTDFLAAAVSLARSVSPGSLPEMPTSDVDAAVKLDDKALVDKSEVFETVKKVAEKVAEKSGTETAESSPSTGAEDDSGKSDEHSSQIFPSSNMGQDLTTPYIGAMGRLEALYRVLVVLSEECVGAIPSKQEIPSGLEEQLEQLSNMQVHGEWLEKAQDVDVAALLRSCRGAIGNKVEKGEASNDDTTPIEPEEKFDAAVKEGFEEYIKSYVERLSDFFKKFKEAKGAEIKEAIGSLPLQEQVEKLTDVLVGSRALAIVSRFMQATNEDCNILGALQGLRKGFGVPDQAEDSQADEALSESNEVSEAK